MKRVLQLLFITFSLQSIGQSTVQDCAGAIPLCNYKYSELNSYQGIGNDTMEFADTNTCYGISGSTNDVEVNSVWYKFTAIGSGNVAFTITPNNLNDDYDWAVFDITNPNHSCQTLHQDGSVSCNWAGVAGPTGPNGDVGAQNNPPFAVTSGSTYAIIITNYSASTNGYTIEFDTTNGTIGNGFIDFTFGLSGLNLTLNSQMSCPSTSSASYTWLVDGTQIGVGSNLNYEFANSGTYQVCMVVDYGGYTDTTCQSITVVESNIYSDLSKNIQVYPNPVKNTLIVDFENFIAGEKLLIIKNIVGREVVYQKLNNEGITSIKIEDLSQGIYMYEIHCKEGILKVDKLVIE